MDEMPRPPCGSEQARRRLVLGLLSLPLLTVRVAPAAAAAGEPVATLAELANPWSAVHFTLRDANGDEQPCIVVRLPDGGWYASSLVCPHNKCDISYVTDVEAARGNFGVDVSTPVLACPCHFSVFDLTRHGAVIAGPAPIAPLQLQVTVRGDQVFVGR
jgi:arsenite oxidase small subunit